MVIAICESYLRWQAHIIACFPRPAAFAFADTVFKEQIRHNKKADVLIILDRISLQDIPSVKSLITSAYKKQNIFMTAMIPKKLFIVKIFY